MSNELHRDRDVMVTVGRRYLNFLPTRLQPKRQQLSTKALDEDRISSSLCHNILYHDLVQTFIPNLLTNTLL